MKKILIISFILIIMSGCQSSKLTTKQINQLVEEDKAIIVDVREKAEYKKGHIKGAILIPLNTIDETINLDKNKKIIVYCQSGNRSKQATEVLIELGYDVYDLGSINTYEGPIVEE